MSSCRFYAPSCRHFCPDCSCFAGAGDSFEVFLVHPGGPFWKNRDDGAWSIPKGLIDEGEEPLAAARREFQEETGIHNVGWAMTTASSDRFIPLSTVRQKAGKIVQAWACEGDADATKSKAI